MHISFRLAARRTIATADGKVDLFGFMHAYLDKGINKSRR